ncbi:MAG: FAD-dependent oxidoreductase [Oscillospiraceae bacterium]
MKYYNEPARKILVKDEVDVLVLGGGPAGVAAAICAARQGAETMLVEQCGCVGGVATAGLMSHWTGKTQGGFYEEVLEKSCDCSDKQIINPEKLKAVLFDMLNESMVKVRLYTFASVPILENDRITGVIIESKSGREAVFAKIVIDATGDGDIAARSGVPFIKGREDDHKMQPVTLMFKVGGVDEGRGVFPESFEMNLDVPKGKIQDLAKKNLPFPAGHVLLYHSSIPGIITCNMTNCINIDGTDADNLTKAEFVCRSQMEPIVNFLKEYVPGFENCYIISSASMIGVRETRHFQGEYTLTEKDILESRVFEDWAVLRAAFNFDVHNITGSGLDEAGEQKKFPDIKGYSIPYRCFVPKKVDNLLLAGRNISGTHLAHSNYRVMPICANMGQSVGIAAAICAKNNIIPRNLDVHKLQEVLSLQGVKI